MRPEDKNICILVHVLGIFTSFLGPLIVWLLKKDESKEIGRHSLDVLNFQITMAIAFFCSFLLMFLLIGFLLLPAVMVWGLVNMILGAVAASKGEFRPYPLTLRLIK